MNMPLNAVLHLQLLELIEPLKRGLTATPEDQEAVEAAVQKLERINPTPRPLESPLLNGQWRLVSIFFAVILSSDINEVSCKPVWQVQHVLKIAVPPLG